MFRTGRYLLSSKDLILLEISTDPCTVLSDIILRFSLLSILKPKFSRVSILNRNQ